MAKTKSKKANVGDDNLRRAVTLAKALNAINAAYFEMDAVFFNPQGYLELHDEIKDKIVELLQGVEL